LAGAGSESGYGLLKQAITEHFCLTGAYHARLRHFCPYALGLDKTRKQKVLALQYGGDSSQSLPARGAWRCFEVQLLSKLKRNKDHWRVEPGAHSRPNACVTKVDVEVGDWRPGDS
jgi:hypothetical protein